MSSLLSGATIYACFVSGSESGQSRVTRYSYNYDPHP